MSFDAKQAPGGGVEIPLMEVGMYPARLVQLIDLGMQAQSYQGKEKKPMRMIAITLEFLDEFLADEDGNPDPAKPRWLTESFALYNPSADKAKSTIWYQAFDPDKKFDWDWSKLLGLPVNANVVQNARKSDGKVFNNVSGVAAMRPAQAKAAPPLVNKPVQFDLDAPDLDVYRDLPKFLQKRIQEGIGFKDTPFGEQVAAMADQPAPEQDKGKSDDNPY